MRRTSSQNARKYNDKERHKLDRVTGARRNAKSLMSLGQENRKKNDTVKDKYETFFRHRHFILRGKPGKRKE